MSLINYILGQKIILITVGVAIFLFLAAVSINFAVAMRATLKRRAERQKIARSERARRLALKRARAIALQTAELLAEGAPEAASEAVALQAVAAPESAPAETVPNAEAELAAAFAADADARPPAVDAAAGGAGGASGAGGLTPMGSASPVSTTGGATTGEAVVVKSDVPPEPEAAPSSKMQSMLSDVFGEEDALNHYSNLLNGNDLVELTVLLAHVTKVAKDLSAKNSSQMSSAAESE